MMDPFFREPPLLDDAARSLLTAESVDRLHRLGEALAEVTEWTVPALEVRASVWLAEQGLELKAIGQPLRVALTGRTASPSLFHVMHVIGREHSLARLARV